MPARLLDGKELSKSILSALPGRIASIKEKRGRPPALAVVNCCEDSGSAVYIRRKLAACEKLGIVSNIIKPGNLTDAGAFGVLLRSLSSDRGIDAIMVERPLPPGFGRLETWEALAPDKDVDGASTVNTGRLFLCKNFREIEEAGFFVPCTALAVIKLLREHKISVEGKRATVVGRSSVVGRPLAHMLSCLDATVTLCHSRTAGLPEILRSSQVVIAAVGKARWLKAGMISPGATVIDVGTNTDETGKFCGDVDFENVILTAGEASPVPGGVGPVTLACLIESTVKAAELNSGT